MSAYSNLILAESGLVSYWRLGEASGTSAADSKGANTGTYAGSPTLGATGALTGSGDTNTAIGPLNGTSQFVSVAHNATLDLADVFTLEAWVSRGATGAVRGIVSKSTLAYYLRLAADGTLNLLKSGTADIVHSTGAVPTGWHHVVATKNGASVHLYLDGADVTGTVTNATCANNTNALSIGAENYGASEKSNASLDEVAVYNTALSAASVLAHYTAGTTPSTLIKNVAGVAYASIKNVLGVARASVKKVSGLA